MVFCCLVTFDAGEPEACPLADRLVAFVRLAGEACEFERTAVDFLAGFALSATGVAIWRTGPAVEDGRS